MEKGNIQGPKSHQHAQFYSSYYKMRSYFSPSRWSHSERFGQNHVVQLSRNGCLQPRWHNAQGSILGGLACDNSMHESTRLLILSSPSWEFILWVDLYRKMQKNEEGSSQPK